MESFDIFVRSYETSLPLITLTVKNTISIEKLKKIVAEECTLFF